MGGSKITADGDCSHEVKKTFVPWKESFVTTIKKKERHHFADKGQYSQNYDHGIGSHHFMANSWGNNGNSEKPHFGGSKITADGDCGHKIKRRLLLGRKVMTNLDSTLKSRDITLPTKVPLVKAVDMRVGL